jgi:hypothetical protein
MSLAVPSIPGAVRLSRSALWEAQRRFYQGAGPEVFTAGILPYQVTSNPAIAQAYARLIAGWLQDLRNHGRGDGDAHGAELPLTIVEIGPGSGRFTYQLLSAVARVLPGYGGREGDVRYVCADISPALLDGIRRHPANRQWVENGTLTFALTDADQSGEVTSSESLAALLKTDGPVVVVANYVFDSLPQDAFYVSSGHVWQTLVSPPPEDVASEPIARWRLTFEQRPAERQYYGDRELDELLARFTDGHTGSLLFPVGSLLFLRELRNSAGDRPLLLLAADKECTPGVPDTQVPHLEFHGDHCFSMAVNFDVIEAAWQAGGSVLKRSDSGELLAIRVLQSGPATGPRLTTAFVECVECNAPDDWFLWSLRIGRDVHTYSLADMMAVLRLSAYDPAVLNDCFTMMFRWLPGATVQERAQLRRILRRVMDNYYFLGEHPDVAFEVGSLLYAIGAHDEALGRLVESEALSGPRPATLYQQARCLYQLGDKRAALKRLQAARAGGDDFEQFLVLSGILDQPRAREFEQRLSWEVSVEAIGS